MSIKIFYFNRNYIVTHEDSWFNYKLICRIPCVDPEKIMEHFHLDTMNKIMWSYKDILNKVIQIIEQYDPPFVIKRSNPIKIQQD